MKKTRVVSMAALSLCLAGLAPADEGMWMPPQIPSLAPRLHALGFEGDLRPFGDLTGLPMGAVVSLGGCSASFVSPDGLIATNHHCATNALQYNSVPERNLLKDGFFARARTEELWNGPGTRLFVATGVADVTEDFNRHVSRDLPGRARYDAVETWTKARTAACEKDGSRCRIASYFGGLQWLEIKQLEIQDVRLVYAPPSGIGNFGGETDNWRWPRHAGDFTLMRAYVGHDGKPAQHAETNVPYKPARWLRVSPKGASPGEIVFVAGFPGRTERLQTAAQIAERTEWDLPRAIRRSEEMLGILADLAKDSPPMAIKIENRRRGLNNRLTKNRGLLEALVHGGSLESKRAQQRELEAWIAADPARRKEFGAVLEELDAVQARASATRERDGAFAALVSGQGSALSAADTIYSTALNRPKPDLEREPEYQERNWKRTREELQRMQKTFDPKIDRALLRYALLEAARLPAGQRIDPLDTLAGFSAGMSEPVAAKSADAFLDRLYPGTKLFDLDARLAMLDRSVEELRASRDAFIDLIAALEPFEQKLRDERKAREGDSSRLLPVFMKAVLAKTGGLVPPDANGTLRVSFGRVEGVSPRDGVQYTPQTTLAGIVEKNTGTGEFASPQRLLDAIKLLRTGKSNPFVDPALKDVPVDFLSTVDTTNGSSGSPTLNARGELVGLLFDGTYDTVISDILYDPRTRSIHVDSRDLLFVLSEVEGAKSLLAEMGFSSGADRDATEPSAAAHAPAGR